MRQDKSIFITGGGSGIGRAVAELFGRRGWFVGLGDISEVGMTETRALLPRGRSLAVRLDVRDRAQWNAALATFAEAAGGRIDVIHNNAGIAYGGALTDLSEDEIDRLIAINLRGVIHGARAAYPWLRSSAPGSCLLNTASAAALYGMGGMATYSATKFAVRALTEALDTEWEADGIRVRSLMPSFIDTALLSGPANAGTNQAKRDTVVAAGLPFTPVEDVAHAAWDAVHGDRLHTLVGATARKMGLAARLMPGYMRERARKLLAQRTDSQMPANPSQDGLDRTRQRDIARAETVSVVGGERDLHAVPHVQPLGMVVHPLGEQGDAGHEAKGGDKVREHEGPGDREAVRP